MCPFSPEMPFLIGSRDISRKKRHQRDREKGDKKNVYLIERKLN